MMTTAKRARQRAFVRFGDAKLLAIVRPPR